MKLRALDLALVASFVAFLAVVAVVTADVTGGGGLQPYEASPAAVAVEPPLPAPTAYGPMMQEPQATGLHYYITSYVWDVGDDQWEPPEWETNNRANYDLRGFTGRAIRPVSPTIRSCCLIAAYEIPLADPLSWYLGQGDALVNAGTKATLELVLQLPQKIAAASVRDLIYELATYHADPADVSRHPPVPANPNGVVKFDFGDFSYWVKAGRGSPEWDMTIAAETLAYAKVYAESTAAGKDYHLKFLFHLADYYRVDYHTFLAGLPDQGVVKPSTTITEDWNCVDAVELDCDLQWTDFDLNLDLVGNTAEGTTTNRNISRADTAFANDDHWCQVEIVDKGGNNSETGCGTRKDSTATVTLYLCWQRTLSGTDSWRSQTVTAGTGAAIGTNTAQETTVGDTVKCENTAAGNFVRYRNGAQQDSVASDLFTNNLYTGAYTFGVTGAQANLDNFQASDGVSGARRMMIVEGD